MSANHTAAPKESSPTASVGFEARLGLAADWLRDSMDAAGRAFHQSRQSRQSRRDLRADYARANPPFNDSDLFRMCDDAPPKGNAIFAWVQHFLYHLAPTGMAGFVLANGSMSSNQSGEGDIRRALIEAALVDCMVALPGQLFYSMSEKRKRLVAMLN